MKQPYRLLSFLARDELTVALIVHPYSLRRTYKPCRDHNPFRASPKNRGKRRILSDEDLKQAAEEGKKQSG
jgi:hypothetical protein